jgi:gliding motility-associated protein GldM
MAGGKLTQTEDDNYVFGFIAMLAMNVSKEVITGFGLMNEKFETSNETSKLANEQLLSALDAKAGEAKEFLVAAGIAHNVKTITDNFNYIASLKSQAAAGFEIDPETGNLPYEDMDKGDNIDDWFAGEGYSAKGNEVVAAINKYKADMKSVLGTDVKYASIVKEVESKFDFRMLKIRIKR